MFVVVTDPEGKCLRILLAHPGCNPNKTNNNHESPLDVAAGLRNKNVVSQLLNHDDIQVNKPTGHLQKGSQALINAVKRDDHVLVEMLQDAGAFSEDADRIHAARMMEYSWQGGEFIRYKGSQAKILTSTEVKHVSEDDNCDVVQYENSEPMVFAYSEDFATSGGEFWKCIKLVDIEKLEDARPPNTDHIIPGDWVSLPHDFETTWYEGGKQQHVKLEGKAHGTANFTSATTCRVHIYDENQKLVGRNVPVARRDLKNSERRWDVVEAQIPLDWKNDFGILFQNHGDNFTNHVKGIYLDGWAGRSMMPELKYHLGKRIAKINDTYINDFRDVVTARNSLWRHKELFGYGDSVIFSLCRSTDTDAIRSENLLMGKNSIGVSTLQVGSDDVARHRRATTFGELPSPVRAEVAQVETRSRRSSAPVEYISGSFRSRSSRSSSASLVSWFVGKEETSPSILKDFADAVLNDAASGNALTSLLESFDIDANMRLCCNKKENCLGEWCGSSEFKSPCLSRRALHEAAARDRPEIVNILIDVGSADVMIADDNGDNPLHVAARVGSAACAGVMIESKQSFMSSPLMSSKKGKNKTVVDFVNSRTTSADGPTALHIAAFHSRLNVFDVLATNGADLIAKNGEGETALHVAARLGKMDVVYGLFKSYDTVYPGSSYAYGFINAHNDSLETPLHIVSQLPDSTQREKSAEIIDFLLEKGANGGMSTNKDNKTALHFAAEVNFPEGIEAILKHANLNDRYNRPTECKTEEDKWTPLHIAADKGYVDVAKVLVDTGHAKTYAKDVKGRTPLQLALLRNNIDFVRAIVIDLQVSVDRKVGRSESTEVHWGVQNLSVEVMRSFLQAIKDKSSDDLKTVLNIQDAEGSTPSHIALKNDKHDMVELFVDEFKADLNVEGDNGSSSLLHAAAKNNRRASITMLMDRDKSLVKSEPGKLTPLHVAVQNDSFDVIKVLVDQCDINAQDEENFTALHYAAQQGSDLITKLLVDKKAKVGLFDNKGRTPLHIAADAGYEDIVSLLLNAKGACPGGAQQDDLELTALHLAAKKGHLNVVKILIKKLIPEEIKKEDGEGHTALQLASDAHHGAIVKLLLTSTDISVNALCKAAKNNDLELVKVLVEEMEVPAHGVGNVKRDRSRSSNLSASDFPEPLQRHSSRSRNSSVDDGWELSAKPRSRSRNVSFADDLEVDVDGNTALHLSAAEGHKEIVEFLISHFKSTDPNTMEEKICAKNADGHKAVSLAAHRENIDCVKILLKAVNEYQREGFFRAIEENDVPLIKCFMNGLNFDIVDRVVGEFKIIKDNNGLTPLHKAAICGHAKTVLLLVKFIRKKCGGRKDHSKQYRQLVNVSDNEGMVPAHYAVLHGHGDALEVLVRDGHADMYKRDKRRRGMIHYAAQGGHTDMVDIIISECKADVNDFSREGLAPIHVAADAGSIDVVRRLIDKYEVTPLLSTNDRHGQNILHRAALKGNKEVVKFLISEFTKMDPSSVKDKISVKDEKDNKAIALAASNGHHDVVNILLEALGDDPYAGFFKAVEAGDNNQMRMFLKDLAVPVNVKENKGKNLTALMKASKCGHKDIVAKLVDIMQKRNPKECQEFIDDGDTEKSTALHYAASKDHVDVIKILLSPGKASVNVQDAEGRTPLHYACSKRHVKAVKILLRDGQADIRIQDSSGSTALHWAALEGQTDVLEALIDGLKQANDYKNIIECEDKNKCTPLRLAVQARQYAAMKLLVRKGGANINVRFPAQEDSPHLEFHTLVYDATCRNDPEMITVLHRDCHANVNLPRYDGHEPLHKAAQDNILEAAHALCQCDDIRPCGQDRTDDGYTPLHYAAELDHTDILKVLIDAIKKYFPHRIKLSIDCEDKKEFTPLRRAFDKGNHASIRLLVNDGEADVNAKFGSDERTLVYEAACKNAIALIRTLGVDCSADVNQFNSNGMNPILKAAQDNRIEVAKVLCECDVDLCIQDETDLGFTVFHWAAMADFTKLLQVLIKAFVERFPPDEEDNQHKIDIPAKSGNTPLRSAFDSNNFESFKMLVNQGNADVEQRDRNEMTFVHLATQKDNPKMIKLLVQECGAQVDALTSDGKSSLHIAAEENQISAVQALCVCGAQMDNLKPDANGYTPLDLCAQHGSTDVMKIIVDAVKKTNSKNTGGFFKGALKRAFGHKQYNAMKMLVKRGGADVDAHNDDGWTLLYQATDEDDVEMSKFLVRECGANVNGYAEHGEAPLHHATKESKVAATESLIDCRADPALPDTADSELTPLHWAAKNGRDDIMDLLIDAFNKKFVRNNQHKIDIMDKEKNTPLRLAFDNDHTNIMKLLVNRGRANVEQEDESGLRFLHLATQEDTADMIKCLVNDCDANVDALNPQGFSALNIAAENNKVAAVRALCEVGADLCGPVNDNFGYTPLHWCARQGHTEAMQIIIAAMKKEYGNSKDYKSRINFQDKTSHTPLRKAFDNNQYDAIKMLVNEGKANVNSPYNTKTNRTYLYHAAHSGDLQMVKVLAEECKADANICTKGGDSPLLFATRNNNVDIARILCECGADPTIKGGTSTGHTALHFCAEKGYTEILEIIMDTCKIGGKVDCLDNNDSTPLRLAFNNNHHDCVKILVHKGNADIRAVFGSDSRTLLHDAVTTNNLEMVTTLVENFKADPTEKNSTDGVTPLHVCAEKGYTQFIEVMIDAMLAWPLDKSQIQRKMMCTDNNGFTPFRRAYENKHYDTIKVLVNQGHATDINTPFGEDKRTFLYDAACKDDLQMVQVLTQDCHASVNICTSNGSNPLLVAAQKNNVNIARVLCECKADSTIQDGTEKGYTAWHYCAEGGHNEIIEIFLNTLKQSFMVSFLAAPNEVESQSDDIQSKTDGVDKQGYTPLRRAYDCNQYETIQLLVNEGNVDVNAIFGADSRTLLYDAASNNVSRMVKVLANECHADVNLCTNTGDNPLLVAAQNNYAVVAKLLCECQADPCIPKNDEQGFTALHWLAENGSTKIIEMVIDNMTKQCLSESTMQIKIDAKDKQGYTPLWRAFERRHFDVIKLLITTGKADDDALLPNGLSMLYKATCRDDSEMVSFMLDECSADPNIVNSTGNSCLHFVAEHSNETLADILCEHSADPCQPDGSSSGSTPLHVCSKAGNTAVLNILVDALKKTYPYEHELQKQVDIKDNDGFTSLQLAFEAKNYEAIKILVNGGGADVNQKFGADNRTFVYEATCQNDAEMIKLLVNDCQADTDLFITENDIKTTNALQYAAQHNLIAAAKALCECNADLFLPEQTGLKFTPLHWCTEKGHKEIMQAIIAATKKQPDCSKMDGVFDNKNKESKEGMTPLQIAYIKNDYDAIRILVNEGGADVNMRFGDDSRTFVYQAALDDDVAMIKLLGQECNADVNAFTSTGFNPLIMAAQQNKPLVIQALCDCHAKLNVYEGDELGYTPLHWFVQENQLDNMRIIIEASKRTRGAKAQRLIIDTKDSRGLTPLRMAFNERKFEAMKLLSREGGADINARIN